FRDPAVWAGVTEQAKTTAAIKDVNVWRIYDLVDQTSFRYIVLEDPGLETEGFTSLADKLRTTSRLDNTTSCFIAWQVAGALAHLHQCNTLLGLLTPDQIWLDKNNRAKVLVPVERLLRPLNLPADEANRQLVEAAD
ncbi:MAG: hypothetical protein VX776_03435, partial [Planctomycetota bacterium]|nr:hypothetical protein [Planctomycetota bacterium]